jgi:hypothetical protein
MFGQGSYVKGLISSENSFLCGGSVTDLQPDERSLIHRARQCHKCSGPKMQPDVFSGEDAGAAWLQKELRMLYKNQELGFANSAREGGRCYAPGCHHFHLPTTSWILLDRMIDPIIIYVMIDVEPTA